MREGISYTVTLNFVITFIIIFFFFLSGTIIYFKTNKAGKIITDSIEKYEGYNELSENAIYQKLNDIGYSMNKTNCGSTINPAKNSNATCNIVDSSTTSYSNGDRGYCIYLCTEEDYYYYRVRTIGIMNLPIVNQLLPIPVVYTTNRLYDFESNLD
jgi:hypothetical protein